MYVWYMKVAKLTHDSLGTVAYTLAVGVAFFINVISRRRERTATRSPLKSKCAHV